MLSIKDDDGFLHPFEDYEAFPLVHEMVTNSGTQFEGSEALPPMKTTVFPTICHSVFATCDIRFSVDLYYCLLDKGCQPVSLFETKYDTCI